MKSRGLQIFLGIVFLMGVALVGHSLYKIYFKKEPIKNDSNIAAQLNAVRSEDYNILKNGSQDEKSVAHSLRRYTAQNLPESEELILKYIYDKRAGVRAAAIESSGAFDWAAISNFKEALQSSDESLRIAALKGMAKRSDADRIALVTTFLSGGNLSATDWLEAQIARYRLMPDAATKKKVEGEILSQAKKFVQPRQDQALSELFALAPNSDELKQLAREILRAQGSDTLAGRALQYQTAFDREWLNKEYAKLSVRSDGYYQTALFDFMYAHCPEGWSKVASRLNDRKASKELEAHCDR